MIKKYSRASKFEFNASIGSWVVTIPFREFTARTWIDWLHTKDVWILNLFIYTYNIFFLILRPLLAKINNQSYFYYWLENVESSTWQQANWLYSILRWHIKPFGQDLSIPQPIGIWLLLSVNGWPCGQKSCCTKKCFLFLRTR